jgi:hypothetical protein
MFSAKGRAKITVDQRFQLYIYQGQITPNDILIRYEDQLHKNKNGNQRSPRHVHFFVDLILKNEKSKEDTQHFLTKCLSYWEDENKVFSSNKYIYIRQLVDQYINKNDYFDLKKMKTSNDDEMYPWIFDACLFLLLSGEEKTNCQKAYAFRSIIEKMICSDKNSPDYFRIISSAVYRG